MIPEIGHFALILALCAALIQATLPLWGAQKGDLNSMALARPAAYTQFLFLTVAFVCLTISFLNDDFSVLYVASNSNTALPTQYKISAVWGAHEGSLLLWALILGAWTSAVATFSRSLPRAQKRECEYRESWQSPTSGNGDFAPSTRRREYSRKKTE